MQQKTLAEILNPNHTTSEEEELRSINYNPSHTPGIFESGQFKSLGLQQKTALTSKHPSVRLFSPDDVSTVKDLHFDMTNYNN